MSQDFEGIDRTYEERWGGDATPADDFGPAIRVRRRRLTIGKLFGGLFNLVLFSILLAALVVGGLGVYASSQIEREPVEGLSGADRSFNVLVIGTDSRDGFSPEELGALGTEVVDGQRTDTIFLLSMRGGRAAMLSFPRDLYVTHCDGAQGRINAAYAKAGASCLVQTVAATSGIAIDHYVEVNMFGFVSIVDAVGGVPIFLDDPLVDQHAAVNLPPGCHVLDGRQAVGFVRARHVDSDLGRIARQQRFLRSLAGEVISANTLVNVPRMFRVVGSAGGSLTADRNLGVVELAQLARAARGLAGAGLATHTVPANAANIGGAAVLVPDQGRALPLYQTFVDGSVLEVAVEEDVTALQPGAVPVRVLNGSGQEGLAASTRDFLLARGFTITDIGNADARPVSVVRHSPENRGAAQLLAEQLPGVQLEEAEGLDQLELIISGPVDTSAPPPPPPTEDPVGAPEVPVGAAAVPDACGA